MLEVKTSKKLSKSGFKFIQKHKPELAFKMLQNRCMIERIEGQESHTISDEMCGKIYEWIRNNATGFYHYVGGSNVLDDDDTTMTVIIAVLFENDEDIANLKLRFDGTDCNKETDYTI